MQQPFVESRRAAAPRAPHTRHVGPKGVSTCKHGMVHTSDVLGQVGLPAPVSELCARRLGRRGGRRWPQRADGGGLSRPCRTQRARPRTAHPTGRRLHTRAALPRPGLGREPVRLLGRPAAPAGRRRARAPPPRVPRAARGPPHVVPVRGRHLDRPVGRPHAQRGGGRRARSGRRRRATWPTTTLFGRIRRALRHGRRDTWVGDAPDRAELEELLSGDGEAIDVVFEASIAEVVEHYVRDERLRTALHGQGIIGTYAGPRDRGTAGVHLMHASGTVEGRAGAWGYVDGGMGQVSFALADAAMEAGAVLAAGVAVASVVPGEGVRLEGGEMVRGHGRGVQRRSEANGGAVRTRSPRRLSPTGRRLAEREPGAQGQLRVEPACRASASAPPDVEPHRAMVTISTGIDATQGAYESSRRGEPAPAWCELYFQSAYDPSVAPAGCHVMSVFAQYVPFTLAYGTWDATTRGDRRRAPSLPSAASRPTWPRPSCTARCSARPTSRSASGSPAATSSKASACPTRCGTTVSGPGHPSRACTCAGRRTHPGGSVMAINGRNAAMAVDHDLETRAPAPAHVQHQVQVEVAE